MSTAAEIETAIERLAPAEAEKLSHFLEEWLRQWRVSYAAIHETALLSEAALEDWNRTEEDAAWAHLQPGL